MKRGAVFIDMASISPKMAREHAAWLKERGVAHLDAPVSGGSFGAAEGSLAIIAGGEQADFDRSERDGVWQPMGRASYIGRAGSGQIAKLANQIMVACNIASVAQGLLFADAGGADPARLPVALAGGHADSRVLQERGRRMINRDFRPGAPIRNFVKDIDTVLATAEQIGLPQLPIVKAVRDVSSLQAIRGAPVEPLGALRHPVRRHFSMWDVYRAIHVGLGERVWPANVEDASAFAKAGARHMLVGFESNDLQQALDHTEAFASDVIAKLDRSR